MYCRVPHTDARLVTDPNRRKPLLPPRSASWSAGRLRALTRPRCHSRGSFYAAQIGPGRALSRSDDGEHYP
jgi:hypothetical protein